MSYPALDAFAVDPRVGPATFRLYMHLQHTRLHFVEPRSVKIGLVAEHLQMGKSQAVHALRWLIDAGYLVEHGRDGHGTRLLTLAWARPDSQNGNETAA